MATTRYVNLTLRVPEAYVDEFRVICEDGIEDGSIFEILGIQPNEDATGQEVTREVGTASTDRNEAPAEETDAEDEEPSDDEFGA